MPARVFTVNPPPHAVLVRTTSVQHFCRTHPAGKPLSQVPMGDFMGSQVLEAIESLGEKIPDLRLEAGFLEKHDIFVFGAQAIFTPDMKIIVAYGTVVGIPK